MSTRSMSSDEAKLRAGRAFEKTEQRKRESEQRMEDQRRSDVSAAAKIQRLRAMRLARDAALESEAQTAAVEEAKLHPKKAAGTKPRTVAKSPAEAKPKTVAKSKTTAKAKASPSTE
jgi:hypothetical protein